MKKAIISIFILNLMLIPALAQGPQYLESKLTVEIYGKTVGGLSHWNRISSSGWSGIGYIKLKELKDWRSYKGGLPISEVGFYRTAGLWKQASIIEGHKNEMTLYRDVSMWTGLIGLGLGLASPTHVTEGATTRMSDGATMGLILALGGLFGYLYFDKAYNQKVTPASFALEVADDYNAKLLQEN